MSLAFEWDTDKAKRNLGKHKVAFEEAATVFEDILSVTFPDPDHSVGENRYLTIGASRWRRILVIAHTNRGDRIRIISARKATRKERIFYEEES